MRSIPAILLLTLAAPAALLAGPAEGIEKIAAYEGTWKIEIEHLNTRFSKAGKETTNLRNVCWRSAGYYVCDQFVNGESKTLIVFTYNSKDDTYNSYPIPAGGGEPASGKLTIKGNVWTFPWEDKIDGKVMYFQVVNVFTAPGVIEYRQEFSEDKAHWTVTARGHEEKVK